MNRVTKLLLAAAAGLYVSSAASASTFVNLQVLGNTDGGSSYSSNLSVTAGQTVFYEVVGQLATPGATNGGFTLASQTAPTDGINSIEFDLNDSANGSFGTAALATSWKQGFGGPVEGSPSGHSLVDTYAAQASGLFVGASSPSVILSGTFTAGSQATETLKAAWNSGYVGGLQVNTTAGQQQIALGDSTELGGSPYVGFSALTLTQGSPVPSPAMLPGIVAILGLGALVRKYRGQIA